MPSRIRFCFHFQAAFDTQITFAQNKRMIVIRTLFILLINQLIDNIHQLEFFNAWIRNPG
jgi:hypothetical protein